MGQESNTHFDPEVFAMFLELAPSLYEKNCTWEGDRWAAELSLVIKRYFKTETAPLGAVQ